jgi:hypothetical protein
MKKIAFFVFVLLLSSFSVAQTIKIIVNSDVRYSYNQMKKNHAYTALFIDIRQDEMTEYMFFVQSKIENNGKYDHSAIITKLENQKTPVYLIIDFPYNDNGTIVKKNNFYFLVS